MGFRSNVQRAGARTTRYSGSANLSRKKPLGKASITRAGEVVIKQGSTTTYVPPASFTSGKQAYARYEAIKRVSGDNAASQMAKELAAQRVMSPAIVRPKQALETKEAAIKRINEKGIQTISGNIGTNIASGSSEQQTIQVLQPTTTPERQRTSSPIFSTKTQEVSEPSSISQPFSTEFLDRIGQEPIQKKRPAFYFARPQGFWGGKPLPEGDKSLLTLEGEAVGKGWDYLLDRIPSMRYTEEVESSLIQAKGEKEAAQVTTKYQDIMSAEQKKAEDVVKMAEERAKVNLYNVDRRMREQSERIDEEAEKKSQEVISAYESKNLGYKTANERLKEVYKEKRSAIGKLVLGSQEESEGIVKKYETEMQMYGEQWLPARQKRVEQSYEKEMEDLSKKYQPYNVEEKEISITALGKFGEELKIGKKKVKEEKVNPLYSEERKLVRAEQGIGTAQVVLGQYVRPAIKSLEPIAIASFSNPATAIAYFGGRTIGTGGSEMADMYKGFKREPLKTAAITGLSILAYVGVHKLLGSAKVGIKTSATRVKGWTIKNFFKSYTIKGRLVERTPALYLKAPKVYTIIGGKGRISKVVSVEIPKGFRLNDAGALVKYGKSAGRIPQSGNTILYTQKVIKPSGSTLNTFIGWKASGRVLYAKTIGKATPVIRSIASKSGIRVRVLPEGSVLESFYKVARVPRRTLGLTSEVKSYDLKISSRTQPISFKWIRNPKEVYYKQMGIKMPKKSFYERFGIRVKVKAEGQKLQPLNLRYLLHPEESLAKEFKLGGLSIKYFGKTKARALGIRGQVPIMNEWVSIKSMASPYKQTGISSFLGGKISQIKVTKYAERVISVKKVSGDTLFRITKRPTLSDLYNKRLQTNINIDDFFTNAISKSRQGITSTAKLSYAKGKIVLEKGHVVVLKSKLALKKLEIKGIDLILKGKVGVKKLEIKGIDTLLKAEGYKQMALMRAKSIMKENIRIKIKHTKNVRPIRIKVLQGTRSSRWLQKIGVKALPEKGITFRIKIKSPKPDYYRLSAKYGFRRARGHDVIEPVFKTQFSKLSQKQVKLDLLNKQLFEFAQLRKKVLGRKVAGKSLYQVGLEQARLNSIDKDMGFLIKKLGKRAKKIPHKPMTQEELELEFKKLMRANKEYAHDMGMRRWAGESPESNVEWETPSNILSGSMGKRGQAFGRIPVIRTPISTPSHGLGIGEASLGGILWKQKMGSGMEFKPENLQDLSVRVEQLKIPKDAFKNLQEQEYKIEMTPIIIPKTDTFNLSKQDLALEQVQEQELDLIFPKVPFSRGKYFKPKKWGGAAVDWELPRRKKFYSKDSFWHFERKHDIMSPESVMRIMFGGGRMPKNRRRKK